MSIGDKIKSLARDAVTAAGCCADTSGLGITGGCQCDFLDPK